MIVWNYTKLFSIEFLHGGYIDIADILCDITISPDEETVGIMNGCRLFYKIDRNIFFCFVQTIASVDTTGGTVKITTENKPLITFDDNAQLLIRITINSGNFLNTSNLRPLDSKNKVFIFSNVTGNKHLDQYNLTKVIPYVNQKDLVKDEEEENCFASIKISFKKNLANGFSLLNGNNEIQGKNYVIQINKN